MISHDKFYFPADNYFLSKKVFGFSNHECLMFVLFGKVKGELCVDVGLLINLVGDKVGIQIQGQSDDEAEHS